MGKYPFKYPELYAEIARRGIEKKELAKTLGITPAGLRYKQSFKTGGDFSGDEMRRASEFLNTPISKLFSFDKLLDSD